jgi:hypothetical protein
MQHAQEVGPEAIERVEKQIRFLTRIHDADLAKDATSHATESSRSNLMALQDTVRLVYGEAVAHDAGNLV